MRLKALPWAFATLAAVACSDANLSEPQGMSPQADAYLNFALDIMEFNSIKKGEIDWPTFRDTAIQEAGNARVLADTYGAIRAALVRIGDNHSFFQPPGGQAQGTSQRPSQASRPGLVDPMTELIEGGFGYVEVPAFSGGGSAANDLAGLYHLLIEQVDTMSVCRWVVDLRGNSGGNMWPMLAGVGPILGDGPAGFFVDADSVVNEWFYEAGEASLDADVIVTTTPFYEVEFAFPPVAVLTDSLTASSGEAITIAFRARPGARSFGQPTFGVSTANAAFGLSDGAAIFLTVATMADRSGALYGGELVPDSLVLGTKTGDRTTDAVLDAALDWLATVGCS